MATALAPFANATITFRIPTATLETDPETGNVSPVMQEATLRALVKATVPSELGMMGTQLIEVNFRGRTTDPVPEGVSEGARAVLLMDGEDYGWEVEVRGIRFPYGKGGIGALVAPLAGDAIEMVGWRQE